MLFVFPPIFEVDTTIFYSYNFVAPLKTKQEQFSFELTISKEE